MKVSFVEIAALELDDAYRHYENEQTNLGRRFCDEVARAINRIVDHPMAYQAFSTQTRRCLIAKFPYGIVYEYSQSGNEILIVAIGHLHRGPRTGYPAKDTIDWAPHGADFFPAGRMGDAP
jgi:plasmid stabilization system protein ParE